MSENPGSNAWYGQGAENNDLDTDAVPDSLPPDEVQSSGCCQADPSSTHCSQENSGSNPVDQPDGTSGGNEINFPAACQNSWTTKRPDLCSDLSSDNGQSKKPEFADRQSSQREDADHHKISAYRRYLPPELNQQHLDILIIHSDEDMAAAEDLKKIIEELHAKSTDGERTPITVGLREEVALYVRNNVDWLDAALACCTYIFVIFTQHLINDHVLSEMAKVSLWATFSREKQDKFCPVYLEKEAKKELKLSVYIDVLSSINMWKDPSNYKQLIEKYIHIAPRIERCRRQLQAAEQYCEKWNDTAAHSTSTENIDFKSYSIEYECCEEDSLDAMSKQQSIEQELHTEVENSPKTSEELENSPKTSEELENSPKTSGELENSPKASGELENSPKASGELENSPKTSEELENSPKASGELENSPKASEELENSPKASGELENSPKTSEELENSPKASGELENSPKTSEELENSPKASGELGNSPQTSEDWHNYYLRMILGAGAVIGLAYLIRKSF